MRLWISGCGDYGVLGVLFCQAKDCVAVKHPTPIFISMYMYKYIKIDGTCILMAQVPGVSIRPPPCTDADDLLHYCATVGNLRERGERARHPYLGKVMGFFAWAKERKREKL